MTRPKWKALSTLCSNFASVFLASLVVPIFIGGFDISEWYVVILGIGFTGGFSWASLVTAQQGRL